MDGRLLVTGVDLDTFKFRSFVGGVATRAVDDFRLANTQNVWIIRPNRVSQLPNQGHPARDDNPQDVFETCRVGLSRETSCSSLIDVSNLNAGRA